MTNERELNTLEQQIHNAAQYISAVHSALSLLGMMDATHEFILITSKKNANGKRLLRFASSTHDNSEMSEFMEEAKKMQRAEV